MLLTIPVLWIVYFLFSLLALNFVYFYHYPDFLRKKWMYTFLFLLLVGYLALGKATSFYFIRSWDTYIFIYPSFILIGVGGCYEFASWIRKRWGEKVYFVFKYSFIAVFILQCLWSAFWIIRLHPQKQPYTNIPVSWIPKTLFEY